VTDRLGSERSDLGRPLPPGPDISDVCSKTITLCGVGSRALDMLPRVEPPWGAGLAKTTMARVWRGHLRAEDGQPPAGRRGAGGRWAMDAAAGGTSRRLRSRGFIALSPSLSGTGGQHRSNCRSSRRRDKIIIWPQQADPVDRTRRCPQAVSWAATTATWFAGALSARRIVIDLGRLAVAEASFTPGTWAVRRFLRRSPSPLVPSVPSRRLLLRFRKKICAPMIRGRAWSGCARDRRLVCVLDNWPRASPS